MTSKLINLKTDTILTKHPLTRPLPPPRLSADPKTVYVSTRSPFISVVKRVRKALEVFKNQHNISITSDRGKFQKRGQNRRPVGQKKSGDDLLVGHLPPPNPKTLEKRYVTIKGTGKAIQKVLSLGLYFQGQKDTRVEIRTGTVECTDDVTLEPGAGETMESLLEYQSRAMEMLAKREAKKSAGGIDGEGEKMDVDVEDGLDEYADLFEEVQDSFPQRTRNTSMVEVVVRLKGPG